MDNHKCQLCSKDFPDENALEVHMKSHMMNPSALKGSSNEEKLCEAHNASQKEQKLVHSSTSSSDDGEERTQENVQKKSAVDSAHSTAAGSTVLEDGENEEVPSKDGLFRKVYKRARNSATVKNKTNEDPSSGSWMSDLTPEETGALILVMMSKDSWNRPSGQKIEVQIEKNDHSQGSIAVKKSKAKGKYKCESCDMSFKSFQALGGHNAKHKRINEEAPAAKVAVAAEAAHNKAKAVAAEAGHSKVKAVAVAVAVAVATEAQQSTAAVVERRTFVCPYCKKVFGSGQALGGHKRSHFSYGTLKPVLRNGEKLEIKLNRQLPASHDQITESESSATSGEEI